MTSDRSNLVNYVFNKVLLIVKGVLGKEKATAVTFKIGPIFVSCDVVACLKCV